MNKIEQIEKAIQDAIDGKSKLNDYLLDYPGFTSQFVKRLLNNLGAVSKKYLEVGVHKCSTFVSCLYKNDLSGIGVDNWSQFEEGGVSKKMAFQVCKESLKEWQYQLIEADYYKLPNIDLSEVDLYFFDGEHGYDSQKWGITHFVPKLKKGCIVIIDDGSWPEVHRGTYDGIKELGLETEYENFLFDEKQEGMWWNGLLIFIFK